MILQIMPNERSLFEFNIEINTVLKKIIKSLKEVSQSLTQPMLRGDSSGGVGSVTSLCQLCAAVIVSILGPHHSHPDLLCTPVSLP